MDGTTDNDVAPSSPRVRPLGVRDRVLILLAVLVLFPLLTRPWLADVSAWRGDAYFHANDYERARSHLDRALFLDRSHARANYILGVIDVKDTRFDEAEGRLELATNGDPDNVDAWFWLGLARYRRADWAGAAEALAQAVARGKDDGYVLRLRERALDRAGSDPTSEDASSAAPGDGSAGR